MPRFRAAQDDASMQRIAYFHGRYLPPVYALAFNTRACHEFCRYPDQTRTEFDYFA